MDTNTQDLSKFGYVELAEAAKLLTAYCDPNQDTDFLDEGIAIEFNSNSGCVFLIDQEYNVGMMNGDDLEQWLNCPECGEEGFLEDMKENGKDCCWAWMLESGLVEESDKFTAMIEAGPTSSDSMKLADIVEGIEDLIPEKLLDEFEMADEDEQLEIFGEICEHLEEVAPDGLSFGASAGDGACFGFWRDEEEGEEAEKSA